MKTCVLFVLCLAITLFSLPMPAYAAGCTYAVSEVSGDSPGDSDGYQVQVTADFNTSYAGITVPSGTTATGTSGRTMLRNGDATTTPIVFNDLNPPASPGDQQPANVAANYIVDVSDSALSLTGWTVKAGATDDGSDAITCSPPGGGGGSGGGTTTGITARDVDIVALLLTLLFGIWGAWQFRFRGVDG